MANSTLAHSNRGPPIPQQDKSVTEAINKLHDDLIAGKIASARAAGFGCMVLARAEAGKAVHTRLFQDELQKGLAKRWNDIKATFGYSKDHASLYFHLHGVLFMVVPHLGPSSSGTLTIELNCSNDILNPTVASKSLDLKLGPQAVFMAPDFTIPFTIDQTFFYYSIRVSETTATIPCSVMAFWKQSIDRKTACYDPQQTRSWFVKRLASRGMLKSKAQAEALIAASYGTSEPVPKLESPIGNGPLQIKESQEEEPVATNVVSVSTGRNGSILLPDARSSSMRVQPHFNSVEDSSLSRSSTFDFRENQPVRRNINNFFSGMTAQSGEPSKTTVAAEVINMPIRSGGGVAVEGKDFGAMATHSSQAFSNSGLGFSSEMFDFTFGQEDLETLDLVLEQPAIVSSNAPFIAAKKVFKWRVMDHATKEVCSILLPQHLNTKESNFTIGPNMLAYFDAAIIEFSAYVVAPQTVGANGELLLLWDEGNFLDGSVDKNQATLLGYPSIRISAFTMAQEGNRKALTFTPKGLGTFLPLDAGHEGAEIGTLRVFVNFPLRVGSTVQEFECSLYVYAKVLSTNIMQPPRMIAQTRTGMRPTSAFFPVIPVNQLLLSTMWDSTMSEGKGFLLTFSPSSVFMKQDIYQPSSLCNLAANCHWWTGDCVFELHVNKTAYHSGVLVAGFGSINSVIKEPKEIFSLTHAVCNINKAQTFTIRVRFESWNGKNFLSAGRKESLPRPDHKVRQRIYLAVSEALQSTLPGLKSVGVTLVLKSIENCEIGGSVPMKPIFGHVAGGSSGKDFFFSETSRFDTTQNPVTRDLQPACEDKILPPHPAKTQMSAQVLVPLREKFTYYVPQYIWRSSEAGRVLVLPCAPWSCSFKKEEPVQAVITNPWVGLCSNFVYWRGSIAYRLIFYKKEDFFGSSLVQVLLESTGFPKEPGLYAGSEPLSTGGGLSWSFNLGPNQSIFDFIVEDDEYFARRYTRLRELKSAASRMSTLSDRHGNLVFYLPPPEAYYTAELHVAAGPDMNFSVSHPPVATTKKSSGPMEGNVYELLPASSGVYTEVTK
nr:polyprotein [Squash chlorotic leaf spot virus]